MFYVCSDEVVRQSGMSTTKNSIDMENHVFMKAKTKEEYLGFVARLILHVREMSKFYSPEMGSCLNKIFVLDTKKGAQNGMPDPINALQNLASQGNRNNAQMMGGMGGSQPGQMGGPQQMPSITASNLLQTLNRPGQNMNNMPGVRTGMGMVPNGGQIPNQLQGQVFSRSLLHKMIYGPCL